MASSTQLKIAIVGAGPVGLSLAAILHHRGIKSVVFDRDSSATARSQGGTLDIHADSGQRALTAAGLLPAFREKARPEGEATRLVKKDGTVLLDENDQPPPPSIEGEDGRGRPEIDRRDLKDLFINALPEGTIRWGKGVASVSPVPGSEQWTLNFLGSGDGSGSGTEHDPDAGPYDLVLGADGAWSRVRPALTHVKPLYAGVSALDTRISAQDLERRPAVAQFIGRGSCMVIAEDRFAPLMRHGDGSARAYACVRVSPEVGGPVPSAWTLLDLDSEGKSESEIDWADEAVRRRFLDVKFGDFKQEIREHILAMAEEPMLRHYYMLPVGLRWEGRPGVSLLGDAAHLMTPFAGVGVNIGMMDALELAEGIVGFVGAEEKGEGLAGMLRRYEEGMWERSRKGAELTANMMGVVFGPGGAEAVAEMMAGGVPPE
ncbi:FAD/NAD(P)-binding domain-containing protein [Hypomontagnella submonticulosa]|nr:FAD/NAD(P)-binding domain-containing protein [Hypomontagnella submonticulosa]